MANLTCNAVSAVQITHLLLGRMRAAKLRGCFVYTSSGGARMRGVLCGDLVVRASTADALHVAGGGRPAACVWVHA